MTLAKQDKKVKFWAHQEALKIIERKKGSKEFVFETGYGPSGLPHIGTFAEVARANAVMLALQELEPEAKIKLIAFSDDRDGLRKLPPNIPNHAMLQKYLGMPLTMIPDPFGVESSFAGYMNAKLKSFLDQFGFRYSYYSSSEFYEAGGLDQALRKVAENYEAIREVFIQTIREEKREGWSPFMPICANCQRVYTTKVLGLDLAKNTLQYHCCLDDPRFPSCGYQGEAALIGKNLKLGWKVDWAARWWAFDVDYELHGEDLLDSVAVSKKIVKILGKPGPITFKYELFLDELGLKISKTKGNAITIEDWLSYSPVNALLYFILDAPNKPKRMGLAILPKLIDEYLQAEKAQTSPDLESALWYTHKLNSDKRYNFHQLSYGLLVNVLSSLDSLDAAVAKEYCYKYDPSLKDNPEFEELLTKAIAFTREVEAKLEKENLVLDPTYVPYLQELLGFFQTIAKNDQAWDASSLQTKIFALAKDNNLDMKAWFQFLYSGLFGKREGPKLGPYFGILGTQRSINLVEKALSKT